MNNEQLYKGLIKKLHKENAFWSYRNVSNISNDIFIEKVMLFLDINDINKLFSLFEKQYVQKVWEQNILNQEPYFHGLNKFFAWYYFNISDPDDYIKRFIEHRDLIINE